MSIRHFRPIVIAGAAFLLTVCASGGPAVQTTPLDEAIRKTAENIDARLVAGTKIAVLNFSSPSEQFSEYVLEELSSYIVNDGKLVVVDRRDLDLIRQEEAFQLSGEVSDESAQAIGRKLGAQMIVSGSLSSTGNVYRFRIKTLAVESAAVVASSAVDIHKREAKVAALLGKALVAEEVQMVSQQSAVPQGRSTTLPSPRSAQNEEDFLTDGNGTITKYIGIEKDVVIPAKIAGRAVTAIGERAFIDNKLTGGTATTSSGPHQRAYWGNQLTSVYIPNGVTSIGEMAFAGNQLAGIDLPNSVISIGENAFNGNKLTGVVIPNSVISIGTAAFAWNQLTRVTIPNSVTSIGEGAFGGNRLISVTISSSVISIGDCAFSDNDDLASFAVDPANPSFTSIGGVLFSKDGKKLLAYPPGKGSYRIPDDVTVISNYAFYNTQTTYITIPDSVISIGDYAFSDNQLSYVSIPAGVTAIGEEAFARNQLTGVIISYGVTSIGSYAFRHNKLTSVSIPDSVTSIGGMAFYDNRLTGVIIPNNVKYMSGLTFSENPLVTITIGNNVWLNGSENFVNGFTEFYNSNGKRGGTYNYSNSRWSMR